MDVVALTHSGARPNLRVAVSMKIAVGWPHEVIGLSNQAVPF
jgi:hypothetical protein